MSKRKVLKASLITLAAILIIILVYMAICFIRYKSFSDSLPRLDVVTENEAKILSKEDYINCTVSLSGCEEEYAFSDLKAGIRGRGNDTWIAYPKKPYRIKFDEKTSLFGESKNKSWVLLAMYNDFSFIKDYLGFSLSEALDNEMFTPSHRYVELYLNGKYNGLYLLTDQVDENKGRTGVKHDFSETDTEVPFLVELDSRAPDEGVENVDWFYVSGKPYTVKYPEADERYTDGQFLYIKNYITKVDELTKKKNVTLAELSEYIDVKSFIDYYIVQEVMGQGDINWRSVYMSKAVGEVLVMGPVWDFDWSVTGPSTGKYRSMYRGNYEGFRSTDNWFMNLYNGSPEFKEALTERFNEVEPTLKATLEKVKEEKSIISTAAKRDKMRWHWYRIYVNVSSRSDEVIEWCEHHIEWIEKELNG